MAIPTPVTQNDIDRLLTCLAAAQSTGESDSDHHDTVHEAYPYDFAQPQHVPHRSLRTLESNLASFADAWERDISRDINDQVHLSFVVLRQAECRRLPALLPESAVMIVCHTEPDYGDIFLAIDASTAANLVDRLLGGDGDEWSAPDTLTPLERTVLDGVITQAISHLEHMLCRFTPLTLRYSYRIEGTPVKEDDIASVYIAEFEITLGAMVGSLTMCLPMPILHQIAIPSSRHDRPDTQPVDAVTRLASGIEDVTVDCSVRLGTAALSADGCANLAVGDIIYTDTPIHAPLDFFVARVPTFTCTPAAMEGGLAIQIISDIEPGKE